MTIEQLTPGMTVNLIETGRRSNLRRSAFAGISRSVPAEVVRVGTKMVTVEVNGARRRVEARQLEAFSEVMR